MNPPILFTTSKIQNLKIIPVRHKCDPIKTFYHSVLPTEDNTTTKGKTHDLAVLYKGALSKHSFTKQAQYHKITQQQQQKKNPEI